MDRGDIYEDRLNEILKTRQLGEVTGGGSQLGPTREIIYCDLEIQASDTSDGALATIARELEALGAPKGSKLLLRAGRG